MTQKHMNIGGIGVLLLDSDPAPSELPPSAWRYKPRRKTRPAAKTDARQKARHAR